MTNVWDIIGIIEQELDSAGLPPSRANGIYDNIGERLDDLSRRLGLCTIQRTGETSIVREPGKDGETDFIMHGTTAWITVANPGDPTETGLVRIEANDRVIIAKIWSAGDEADEENSSCYSYWADLNPGEGAA